MGISPATMGDSSSLLELAASDDLVSFQRAVEVEKVPVDVPAAWYGRWSSSSPKFELRTPLMIASLYGSVSVLQYILSNPSCSGNFDVSRRCGSDSSTALHLAVAGGSDGSAKVVKLLLDAGADVNAVDSGGNKAVDLIPRRKPSLWGKTMSTVEFCRLGDSVCSLKEEDEKEEEVGSPATPKQNLVSPGGEKKEYPVDVTLPDIKTGIYGTDDFRMYTFKVKPCSRAYSHDWTECPFVHPGENARRRDPRKYHYSCVPCPDFRKGSCRNGDACEYAHGVFESWLHPAQYRTRLCKDEIGCNRRVCFFAHKPEELRPLYNSSGSPGSVASSPRSTVNLPPLDLNAAAAAILMNQAPMSPSSSAALAAAVWLNQNTGGVMTTPTSQLHSSRLKSALSARDMDLELELLALDAYHHQQQLLKQQKLIDEIGGDLYSSPDTTLMSPLKNLSLMKQSAAVSQFSSPSALQKQLLNAYTTAGGSLRSSPPVPRSSSPSFGVDNNSIPSALINSRASAFAKRSQSFIDRGALNRQPINSQITPTNNSPSPGFSDWGSPSGILDWKIHGEELNKLRKSASFGIRANGTSIGGGAPGFSVPAVSEDPDLSWTQSIGKRYDVNHQIHQQQQQQQQQQEKIMMMMNKKQQQFNLNSSADEFHPGDIFASSWSDQLRFDQEKLVA